MNAPAADSDSGWPGDRAVALAVAALTAAAFALRAPPEWLWLNPDECAYWHVAAADSLAELWERARGHAHPPLYLFVLWLLDLPPEPAALRFPSRVMGALLVPATFAWASLSAGRATGLVAAALVTFSPGAVLLSQVARPYAFQMTFLVLAAAALLAWWRRPRAATAAAYGVCFGLALVFHYSSLIALAAVVLVGTGLWMARPQTRPRLRRLGAVHLPLAAVALLLVAAHVLPVLAGEMRRNVMSGYLSNLVVASPREALRSFVELAGSYTFAGVGAPLAPALLAGAGVVSALVAARARPLALPLLAMLPLALGLSAAALYPFGGARHCAYLLPFLVGVVAHPLARLLAAGSWAARGAGILLLAVLLVGRSEGGFELSANAYPRLELAASREEVEELRRALVRHRPSMDLLVSDRQSAMVVRALFALEAPEREAEVLSLDPPLRWIRWDGVAWIQTPNWEMSLLGPGESDLEATLRVLRGDPRFRDAVETGELWVLEGGWMGLESVLVPPVRGAPIRSRIHGGSGIALFRLHPEGFSAWRAEAGPCPRTLGGAWIRGCPEPGARGDRAPVRSPRR